MECSKPCEYKSNPLSLPFNRHFLSSCSKASIAKYRVSMISPKKLVKIARKWRKRVAIVRKRVPFSATKSNVKVDGCNTSTVSKKGHFVIYTADEGRFEVPLAYLNHTIFLELFKKSEEEFGLSGDGPITLPCDAVFMDYIILLIQSGAAKDFEKALLNSITTRRCSSPASQQGYAGQNLLVCVC